MNKEQQIKHLCRDKRLAKVISSVGHLPSDRGRDLYLGLLRAIVGQQLSIKAAATIWNRFLGIFEKNYPEPENLKETDNALLRSVGLSGQKAGYLKNIALFAGSHSLEHARLKKLDDEELILYLVQIKGVGRWTAEMLLMFNLGRPDVFPLDDLGIQNSIVDLYDLNPSGKKQMFASMLEIAEKWRPFRSLACKYLWKGKDFIVAQKKTRSALANRV